MMLKQATTGLFFMLLCIWNAHACNHCNDNVLSSQGGFAKFYPRFLGNWVHAGFWDNLPFFYCYECQGLRAYALFIRDSPTSSNGQWAITDCFPDDTSACGGGAHRLLLSPRSNVDTHCIHELPQQGWQYCSGDLVTGGICTEYATDDTVDFACQ